MLAAYAYKDGAVFVSVGHVYRWTGAKIEQWAFKSNYRLFPFRVRGMIYFQVPDEGVFRFTEGGPKLLIPQSEIGPSGVGVAWMDRQPGRDLLVTGSGILVRHNGKTEPFAPAVSELMRDGHPTTAVRLPDGRYAIATLNHGIVFMRPDGTLDGALGERDGFKATYIPSLLLDGDGSLWAPSTSRILRITLDPDSRIFDSRSGLDADVFRAIAGTGDDITIAGTNAVYSLAPNHHSFTEIIPSFTGVHDLVSTPRGLVVCGFKGAWFARSRSEKGLLPNFDSDIQTALPSRSHPGKIFLTQDPAKVVIALNPDGTNAKVVENLPDAATSLAESNDGRLWMGTDTKGLLVARLKWSVPVSAVQISGRFGLPRISGLAVVRSTAEGDILVFSNAGAWVLPVARNRFVAIDNYPARELAAVSNFRGNVGWVVDAGSPTVAPCVGEIVVDAKGAHWFPHYAVGLDAIGAPRSIFAQKDQHGRTVLWIGGTKSVLRHVVERGLYAPKPRPPVLQVFVRSKDGADLQPITGILPYSTGAVEFDFAAPQYVNRGQLRLQTKIDGVDSDWVAAGAESHRVLTALRDGTYTFRVRTMAETGVASDPTVFTFEVAPPWWRTTWAVALEGALALALGFVIYRLRVRSLRRRNLLLEQKVQERTEELAEASAAKTLFVANMSHDIRNPLNGIVGLTLALEDSRLDGKQRELIATLRECTTYLSSLVDDVLDFASIEAGKIELRPGPFVPAELLNSVVTTLKAETAARGAFITIETDPEVPHLLVGDAGRIQQILVNYVSNALKYAGGHIRLAAGVSPSSPGEIEFSVADEGPGISATEQASLFTKFARLPGARRKHIPGTGLGLASCRLLADFMGGAVGVESEEGHGARFHLRLPLVIATEAMPAPEDFHLPPTTVLLVEDTDYNAMAARAVLSKLGLTCDRAATGAEALRLFAQTRHNIVLLDRNLPDMDGTELARRMREIETDGLRSVLLAVTAYCTADDRKLCLEAGMDAFLGKPLTPEKLRRVLIGAGDKMVGSNSVEVAADTTGPKLDTTLLEYLADGTPGGVAAQAQRFLGELADAHNELMATISRGNYPAVADAAHRLLGQARMVGAAELMEAALELEKAARKPDVLAVSTALPRIGREVAALMAAIRRRPGMQKV